MVVVPLHLRKKINKNSVRQHYCCRSYFQSTVKLCFAFCSFLLYLRRSRTFGRRRLGAGVWAPPFGRTAVWAPDVWAPALMREEIGFYRHYHYFINPV